MDSASAEVGPKRIRDLYHCMARASAQSSGATDNGAARRIAPIHEPLLLIRHADPKPLQIQYLQPIDESDRLDPVPSAGMIQRASESSELPARSQRKARWNS